MLFHTAFIGAVAGLAAAAAAKKKSTTTAAPACSTTPSGWETSFTATATDEVAKAAATAHVSSPTSNVQGVAFNNIHIIMFENTDFDKAYADPNFRYFADMGITYDNYYAVSHPSEPNYAAPLCGDYFGMDNDDLTFFPANISTVFDLLDERSISWSCYEEDMPYAGFEGFGYANQETGANDYLRKHNGCVLFDSVTKDPERLGRIKNISMIDTRKSSFHEELDSNKLPQYSFITPNMTSDAHDTNVTVAGKWLFEFLNPLMDNPSFMKDTVVIITFDENSSDSKPNQVLTILLHDKMPLELQGTKDSNFYTHYSLISILSANWKLGTLGRFDVGANVPKYVGDKTGDRIRRWSSQKLFQEYAWNISYAGLYNKGTGNTQLPAPNLALDANPWNGRPINQKVIQMWKDSNAPTYYKDTVELPDGLHPPLGYAPDYGVEL